MSFHVSNYCPFAHSSVWPAFEPANDAAVVSAFVESVRAAFCATQRAAVEPADGTTLEPSIAAAHFAAKLTAFVVAVGAAIDTAQCISVCATELVSESAANFCADCSAKRTAIHGSFVSTKHSAQ